MTLSAVVSTGARQTVPILDSIQPRKRFYLITSERFDLASSQAKSLICEWHKECLLLSSTSAMRDNLVYKALVGMGRSALPAIIDDLKVKPSMLVIAAADITGENPISDSMRGNVVAMAGAWIGWFQRGKSAGF